MIRTLAAATLIASVFAAPTQAAPRSKAIELVDLDLATQAGRNELDRRIAAAAVSVCGVKAAGDAIRNAAIDECRIATLNSARKEAAAVAAARGGSTQLAVRAN